MPVLSPQTHLTLDSFKLNTCFPGSPRLLFDTDSIVVARQGTSAVMSLSILAYPAPTLSQWQRLVHDKWEDVRNTTSFVLTSSSLQYNLTVMSVTRQLYGIYNLTIENGVGSPLIFTFKLQNKGMHRIQKRMTISETICLYPSTCKGTGIHT